MSLQYQVIEEGENIRIFLELENTRLAEASPASFQRDMKFSYGILQDYNSKDYLEKDSLSFKNSEIVKRGDHFYMSFSVKKRPMISAVILMDVMDTKSNLRRIYDIPINFSVVPFNEKIAVFQTDGKRPYFTKYLLVRDTFLIKSLSTISTPLIVRKYQDNFPPAQPPMNTDAPLDDLNNLSADSTFTIELNSIIQFKEPGLYFIQSDTSQYYGLSVYVSDRRYPKLSRVNDLIEPLIYITTAEEYNSLMEARDSLGFEGTKIALDKLWLKFSQGNVALAKRTIREYYQRIRKANQYFTSYKPGWQTDMGMIFTIFGNPNRIRRTNATENWSYTQNTSFSEIKFTFRKKKNGFIGIYYELVRFPQYEQVWYPVIEKWREGRFAD